MKRNLALAVSAAALGLTLSPLAMADFIGDSTAEIRLRNYYFNNDNRNGTGAPSKTEEWGQYFLLDYRSGFTEGTVGFGVDALGVLAVRLDSGKGRHVGSSMIPSDTDGSPEHEWSHGGAAVKARLSKTTAIYGNTLRPMLPILIANDGRLVPQYFQGTWITSQEIDGLTLHAGMLEKAIGRGSSNRTGLSTQGGAQDSNKFYFAGGDWLATENLKLQYYYANLEDYYKQHFGGLTHTWNFAHQQSLTTDLRYFHNDSDGNNGSTASRADGWGVSGYKHGQRSGLEVDNDTWSATFIYKLKGHSLLAGYQKVDGSSNFRQLDQGGIGEGAGGTSMYLYTDRLINGFNRAGERTMYAQYGFDFADLGIPGLRASIAYLKGDQIRGGGKEWERDFNLDYTIQSGPLKDVSIGWRNASYRTSVASQRDQDQNRLFVNYTLKLM